MCPLCLKTFPLEALEAYALSVEHVPPQNQGPPFTQVLIWTECAWIRNGEWACVVGTLLIDSQSAL